MIRFNLWKINLRFNVTIKCHVMSIKFYVTLELIYSKQRFFNDI